MFRRPRKKHRVFKTQSVAADFLKMVKQSSFSCCPGAVSFSPLVVVHEVLHIDHFSDDEIDACWYNEEEYLAMREDIRHTKQLIRNRVFVDEETRCRRGVVLVEQEQDNNNNNNNRKHKNKKTTIDKSLWSFQQRTHVNAIHAVLWEQQAQRMRNQKFNNDEMIALAYGQFTLNSQFEAYLTGVADADEVRATTTTSGHMVRDETETKRKVVDSPPTSPQSRVRKLKRKPRASPLPRPCCVLLHSSPKPRAKKLVLSRKSKESSPNSSSECRLRLAAMFTF